MTGPTGGFAIVDNPLAPDMFADNALSFAFIDGVVRITLSSLRATETGQPVSHIAIGQLVMPAAGAQRFCLGLYNFLMSEGLDPNAVAGSQGQQVQ